MERAEVVKRLLEMRDDIEGGDEMAELTCRMDTFQEAAERIQTGEDIAVVLDDEGIDIEDLEN